MSCRGIHGFDTSGFRAPYFIKSIRENQSFNHLSDDVIKGWLLGRLEQEIFGQNERSRSFCVNVKCFKCHGRGWFGRGRPDCPECIAKGQDPVRVERRWKEPDRFSGLDKRRLHEIMWNIDLIEDRSKWAKRFEQAIHNRQTVFPGWINDITISGNYCEEDKAQILSEIVESLGSSRYTPLVVGDILRNGHVPSVYINIAETLIRMALTFGCTCPITGRYVSPQHVFTKWKTTNPWQHENDMKMVRPLGFCARKKIYSHETTDFEWLEVTPFSLKGKKAINRSVSRCLKALDGSISADWVLADVMQTTLLKRVV